MVVAVMDRGEWGANADNIAVVYPRRRRVLVVPRDLWSERAQRRVNRTFAYGGHEGLLAALADNGIRARHCVCVRREATEAALDGASIVVPVPAPLRFWYPLEPQRFIWEGRKQIAFEPPSEVLEGERIHQWLGARYVVDGAGSDLERIERQKVFVRCLLEQGFDFRRFVADPRFVAVSHPKALRELAKVRASWRFDTLSELFPAVEGGAQVLRRHPPSVRFRRRLRRARWRLRALAGTALRPG